MANSTSTKRLDIDRKMLRILPFAAIMGICMILLVIVATNSISTVRAFSSHQTFWADTRKDASYELVQYILTGNSENREEFNDAMNILEEATQMRKQFGTDEPDIEIVRHSLRKLNMPEADINSLVESFRWIRLLPIYDDGLKEWKKSDDLVSQYYNIANTAASEAVYNNSATEKAALIYRIDAIDQELDQSKYQLALYLSMGGMMLNWFIITVGIVLGILLVILMGIFFFHFRKSIKNWLWQIRKSEQRYKSLYEQNPHAVFSMDRTGKIINGNSSFSEIFPKKGSGHSISHISDLFVGQDSQQTEKKLEEVKEGLPLSVEMQWNKNPDELLHLHNTIMPIVVDGNFAGMYGVTEDITSEKNAESQIRQQLEEKTILLAEIHHRVKNNMAIISGLLELQKAFTEEAPVLRVMEEAQNRIKSMAMIHEKIYQNDSLANINYRNYIEELTLMIAGSFDLNNKEIALHIEAENVDINLDQSIPCGLILNELICNAYEHAFIDQRDGNIWVSFSEENNYVKIKVSDDGVGLPYDWKEKQSDSLGLVLIHTLSSQLQGTCSIQNNGTTQFEITFEKKGAMQKQLN